jgi:hypothetical protein
MMINFRLSAFVVLGSFMVAVGGLTELRASPFDGSPLLGTWQGTVTKISACFERSENCGKPKQSELKLEFKIDPSGNLIVKKFEIGPDMGEKLLHTLTLESTVPNFITTLKTTFNDSGERIIKDVGPYGFSNQVNERYTMTLNTRVAQHAPKTLDDALGTRAVTGQLRLQILTVRPDSLFYMETSADLMQHPVAMGFSGAQTEGYLKKQPDSMSPSEFRHVK